MSPWYANHALDDLSKDDALNVTCIDVEHTQTLMASGAICGIPLRLRFHTRADMEWASNSYSLSEEPSTDKELQVRSFFDDPFVGAHFEEFAHW